MGFLYQPIYVPSGSGSTYDLVVTQAGIVYTSFDVALKVSRLSVDQGDVVYTASPVTLKHSRLAVDQADVAYTSFDVGLQAGDPILVVEQASVSYSPQNVILTKGATLPVTLGSVQYTPGDVTLKHSRIVVEQATVVYSGFSVILDAPNDPNQVHGLNGLNLGITLGI